MRSREIIGTAVAMTDYEGVLEEIDDSIAQERRIYVCCAPASSLVNARDDADLATAFREAAIVTPDGMGVVHAARRLGESLSDRVYGPDLMTLQLERSAENQTPLFLYGGHDQAALTELESVIGERYPGAAIAGSWSPPHRPLTAAEEAEVVERINASGAKIVWVGIGSPKQEIWMQRMRSRLDAPVLVGVGAAFDFLTGRVTQAPRWMQKSGLEWLHRVKQDPMRLGRRYLRTLPRFVMLVVVQVLRERRQRVTK